METMPPIQRRLFKADLLNVLFQIDMALEGYTTRKSVYLVGGSFMAYEELRGVTKDIDLIMSRQHFRDLSGIIAEIEHSQGIRIDVFPDGQLTGYSYPTYAEHAVRLPVRHVKLDVFRIDDVGFLVMKALAARPRDLEDIDILIGDRGLPSSDEMTARFTELRFEEGGFDEEFRQRFERFMNRYYL